MEQKKLPQIKSKVGGQALIEGVMMRGIDKVSMAVRKENGEIVKESWAVTSLKDKKWFCKVPFIRGLFNMVDSLMTGYKALMKSASYIDLEEEEQPSKLEQKLMEKFGDKLIGIISGIGMVFGVVIALVLFMYLPALAVKGVGYLTNMLWGFSDLGVFRSVIEGVIKICIFVVYLALVSQMKDIKRVFMYHGAEHKSIACYEAGEELTVENARRYTRFHPRCGTSFILIVLIISIIASMFVTWNNLVIRVVLKMLMLPIVVGIAYEFIRLAGKYDNIVTRIISAPGLWLQRLTTREPEDSMLEVAIAALEDALPENREEDRWDM